MAGIRDKSTIYIQIMTGESGVRRAEDIGGQELSYAEVKAIASGNPAVLTLAETDAELQRLTILNEITTTNNSSPAETCVTYPTRSSG